MSTIEPENIEGVGLVFVRKDDPYSHFILSVTKQLYSLIGFYYISYQGKKKKTNIILSDITGIKSSTWMKSFTIKNLIYDANVTELAIKRLAPAIDEKGCIDVKVTKEREGNFKAAIADISALGSETSVNEWVKQLFGHEIGQPTSGSTTQEFVNRVTLRMGDWDKIDQDTSISVEGLAKYKKPKFLPKTSEGKNHIFFGLGKDFKQQEVNNPNASNKAMRSYLRENKVYEPLKRICLPQRNELDRNLRREKSISEQKTFLSKAVSSFVNLLFTDSSFYNTVIDGINQNTMVSQKIDQKLKHDMFDLIKSGNDIVNALVSMLEKGRIKYENLVKLSLAYKQKVTHTLSTCDMALDNLPSISGGGDKIVVFENCKKHQSKFDLVTKQMHQVLNNAIKNINNKKEPVINLNVLINSLNTLVSMSGSELPVLPILDGKKSYSGIITSEYSDKCVPIRFRSGKKVYIPSHGYDLTSYNKEELKELLCALDVTTDEEDVMSSLKHDITKCLSKYG